MLNKKATCFYLAKELTEKFPWSNKSEFVEIAVLFSIDAFNSDPIVQDQFLKLRELRRNNK